MANERKTGKRQTGDSLEVNLREMVKQKLQEERATEILDVQPTDDMGATDSDASGGRRRVKVPIQVQAQYFREISVLLEAGFPVLRALRIAGRGKASPLFSATLTKVANQVENGTTLWRAMQSHPRVFPNLAVSIVRAGEASGTLDEALVYLSDNLEYEADIRVKVRSAFDYPIFFAMLTLAVVGVLIFLVLPRFEEVYQSLANIKKISSEGFEFLLAFKGAFPMILLIVGVCFAFLWVVFRSRRMMALEKLKLRIPIFGKVLLYADLTRFAKTLSIQVKSSVPILEALRLSRLVIDNRELQKMVHEVRVSAEQGGQLAEPFKRYAIVPDTVVDMVEIGEESGSLDSSLDYLAKMLQNKMETTISRLTALLQPVLLLVMGGVVVGIFVTMLTPYLQVLDAIQSSGLQPMGSNPPAPKARKVNRRRKPPTRIRTKVKVDRRVLPMNVNQGKSPTKAPVRNAPTKTPARNAPTKAPARKSPTRAPVRKSPTKAPVRNAPTKTPARKSPTKAPVRKTPALPRK